MSDTDIALDLPDAVHRFVAARKAQGGVAAALLYGSFARGTAHEQSDVDIIFIVEDGFKSEAVTFEGRLFEVLETTTEGIISYWKQNFEEDRHWYLWKDAKVLYEHEPDLSERLAATARLVDEVLGEVATS